MKKRRRKGYYGIAFLACMLVMLCFPSSTRHVLAATGISVEAHSQSEIKDMAKRLNPQKTLANSYAVEPVNTYPYALGQVSGETLQNGLNTLNLIRYIAGIPYNVQIKEEYQEMAQAAVLISSVQGTISHAPSQPSGMEQELYDLAAEGAGSSNLGMGYSNLYQAIVSGWMSDEDSSNIDRIGHRRWCLNPTMQYTGFGINGRYYSMYAFDGRFVATNYSGVAWPAQNMPLELFDRNMPWSISMGREIDSSSVSVTLKRINDGSTWNFSQGASNGDFYVNNDYYGQQGCIIFRPAGIEGYKEGDSFQVTISGNNLSVNYSVDFFWMHDHIGGTATCQNKAVCSVCGTRYGSLGEHQFSAEYTVDQDADCTRTGEKSRHCTVPGCSEKKDEQVIPAKGHTEVTDAAVATTCTTAGKTEGSHCSVCGAVLKAQQAIPAKGHTEVTDAGVAATCTTAGKTEGSHCSVCGIILKTQTVIPAKGHTATVDAGVAATCTTAGKTEGSHCSVCGIILKTQTVIPAKGHIEVTDAAAAATCTTAGKTEGSHCSVCGIILKTQTVIPAKGHIEVTDAAAAATCTTAGKTEGSHCSVCGAVLKAQQPIPAKGHTEVTDAAAAATCTAAGKTEGSHCSVCGAVLKAQQPIPAKGHTEVTDAGIAATCTTTGKTKGSHCSVCGAVLKAQQPIPAKGHTEVTDAAVAATCTTAGKTEGSHCSVCGVVVKAQTVIPAKGHTYKNKVTPASTSKDGMITPTCSVCGAVSKATPIAKIKEVKLSSLTYTYNGKAKKPTVKVTDSKGKTIPSKYYKVSYSAGLKNVGKYTVKVTFKENYAGTTAKTFTIIPKNTSGLTLIAKSKGFTAKWKKQATQTTGYQIQYSTNSKFKGAKTITVKKNKTISATFTKMKAKQKYYVRIRTYKTVKVNGKSTNIYANWSKAKIVRTKK